MNIRDSLKIDKFKEISAKTSAEYLSQIEQKVQLKKKAMTEKNYKNARNASKQIDQFQKEVDLTLQKPQVRFIAFINR